MAYNGIFVMEASDVHDGKRNVTFLFVFDVDPVDLAETRLILTPAQDTEGNWLLGEVAEILIEQAKPGVVAALNGGDAVYQIVQMAFDDPLQPAVALAEATLLWQEMEAQGQKALYTSRFEHAGTWADIEPAAAPA